MADAGVKVAASQTCFTVHVISHVRELEEEVEPLDDTVTVTEKVLPI
jgi:hypothetical protein